MERRRHSAIAANIELCCNQTYGQLCAESDGFGLMLRMVINSLQQNNTLKLFGSDSAQSPHQSDL